MAYTKQTWADLPSKTTPINANRLTHIEDGIFNAAATADTAASTAGTAAANVGIVSGKVETLTERVNGLDTAVSNKVDKVAGKGLSTNDYDDTDKAKVDSLGTASTKNSTSVVTDSTDLVESGAVEQTLRDAEVVEGKNLFNPSIVNWNSYTYADGLAKNNITDTRDSLLLQIQGRKNGSFVKELITSLPITAVGNYEVEFTIGSSDDINQFYIGHNGSTNNIMFVYPFDLKGTYKLSFKATGVNPKVVNGIVLTDIMISANGGAYEPYYIPLKDTIPNKCDNSTIAPVENGTTASQAYAVGEHFIRDGKFCTVTVAVTTSSTWTLNSNYVEGDVAKILDKKTGSMTFADSEISSNITRVNEKSGVVCISASVYTATSKYTQNQYVRIATISGVAKPDSEVRFPVINSNGSIMIGLLTTSGDIFIYNYSATSGGTITFNFSYEV